MTKQYNYYIVGAQQKHKELIPNQFYHIIQRAPGKERLFNEDSDYASFVRLLQMTCEKYHFNIHGFCLMPNHIHLIGLAEYDNFSWAMWYLFRNYAIYYNNKYLRKGHVFHGPFRVVLVDTETYLIVLSTYIHLNPVRAKLVNKSIDWKWSSIESFLNPSLKSFVKPQKVLKLLNNNIQQASRLYKTLIDDLEHNKEVSLNFKFTLSQKDTFSFYARNFEYFVEKLKSKFMQKEAQIMSSTKELLEKAQTIIEKKKAYLYAIEQLLSQGYPEHIIKEILNLTDASFRRYLAAVKNPIS